MNMPVNSPKTLSLPEAHFIAEDNPEYINLGTAENVSMATESAKLLGVDRQSLRYNLFEGTEAFRSVIYQQLFADYPGGPEHLLTATSFAAVLDMVKHSSNVTTQLTDLTNNPQQVFVGSVVAHGSTFGVVYATDSTLLDAFKEPLFAYPVSSIFQLKVVSEPDDLRFGEGTAVQYDRLIESFCGYAKRWAPEVDFNGKSTIIGSGVTAVLEVLFCEKFKVGDKVVVLAPVYSGYRDDVIRSGVELVPAYSVEELIELAKSPEIAGILLCNPNNPTGVIHSEAQIRQIAALGKTVIFDELYPLSRFDDIPFFSALNLDDPNVIVCTGAGKDLGLCGLKIGFGFLNSAEITPDDKYQVPLYTADLLADFLNADALDELLAQNSKALYSRYQELTSGLDDLGIPYIRAQAGFFILFDLSNWMGTQSEAEFWQSVFYQSKLNISPGKGFYCQQPGWFRLCYMSDIPIKEILGRLRRIIMQQNGEQHGNNPIQG